MNRQAEKALIFAAKHNNTKCFEVLINEHQQMACDYIAAKVGNDEAALSLLEEVVKAAETRIVYFDENVPFKGQLLRLADIAIAGYFNEIKRNNALSAQEGTERAEKGIPLYPEAEVDSELQAASVKNSNNKKYNIIIAAIIAAALIIIAFIFGFMLIPEVQREKAEAESRANTTDTVTTGNYSMEVAG